MPVPIATMKNVRQQSAVKMDMRTARRLATSGPRYSCGMFCNAVISLAEMKSGKNTDGIMANSRAMPPVAMKLIATQK